MCRDADQSGVVDQLSQISLYFLPLQTCSLSNAWPVQNHIEKRTGQNESKILVSDGLCTNKSSKIRIARLFPINAISAENMKQTFAYDLKIAHRTLIA